MKLSEHFALGELTRSSTALRHEVDNIPNDGQIVNLRRLCDHILEPVRQHFGIPFSPSSGFRCLEVNRLVGSKDTSQHREGRAADFEVPTVPNHVLASWIYHNCEFDQVILEFYDPKDPQSGWVHASVKAEGNRREFLSFDGKNYKRMA